MQWSFAQIVRLVLHLFFFNIPRDDDARACLSTSLPAHVSLNFSRSAIDCNIDLLDTLTLSVLVAQTARDLKKSPRKLLLNPLSAVLILLLRVVLPMLTATFLTDFW